MLISRAGSDREPVARPALKVYRSCMHITRNDLPRHQGVARVARTILGSKNPGNCPVGTWGRVASHCSEPVPPSSCSLTN